MFRPCSGVTLTTHLHGVPSSRMSRSYTSSACYLLGGSGTPLPLLSNVVSCECVFMLQTYLSFTFDL
jgi:hypothetical protein